MGQLLCKSRSDKSPVGQKRARALESDGTNQSIEEDEEELYNKKRSLQLYEENRAIWLAACAYREVERLIDSENVNDMMLNGKRDGCEDAIKASVRLLSSDLPLNGRTSGGRTIFGELVIYMSRLGYPLGEPDRVNLANALIDRILRDKSLDLDVVDELGHTCLHYAVELLASWRPCRHDSSKERPPKKQDEAQHALVWTIMKHMKSPETKNYKEMTPLMMMVSQRKFAHTVFAIREMIKHGADTQVVDKWGRTLLHLIALTGDYALLQDFTQNEMYGVDWRAKDYEGKDANKIAFEAWNTPADDSSDSDSERDWTGPKPVLGQVSKILDAWAFRCRSYTITSLKDVGIPNVLADLIHEYLDGSGRPFGWQEREALMDAELEELMAPIVQGGGEVEVPVAVLEPPVIPYQSDSDSEEED